MNIYIVETRLQLVNATEAKHKFESIYNVLIIFYSKMSPIEAFQPLLVNENWTKIIYFQISDRVYRPGMTTSSSTLFGVIQEYFNTLKQFKRRRRLDAMLDALPNADALFLGNYLIPYMRHSATRLKYRKLVALDDGTDTLRINDLRKRNCFGENFRERVPIWKSIKSYIRKEYIDWTLFDEHELCFFSTYDLEVKKSDSLITNNYEHLRRRLNNQRVVNEVYFLGEPLCEDGYISDIVYSKYLTRIQQYFAGQKFIYVPHPRESNDKVTNISAKHGFPVRRFNVPIEIQLILGEQQPIVLASFFSTALDNCRLIFGQRLAIKAFYIDRQDLNVGYDFIYDIYDYLDSKITYNFDVLRQY